MDEKHTEQEGQSAVSPSGKVTVWKRYIQYPTLEETYVRYILANIIEGGKSFPRPEWDVRNILKTSGLNVGYYIALMKALMANGQDRLSDFRDFFENRAEQNVKNDETVNIIRYLLYYALQSGRKTDEEPVKYLLEKISDINIATKDERFSDELSVIFSLLILLKTNDASLWEKFSDIQKERGEVLFDLLQWFEDEGILKSADKFYEALRSFDFAHVFNVDEFINDKTKLDESLRANSNMLVNIPSQQEPIEFVQTPSLYSEDLSKLPLGLYSLFLMREGKVPEGFKKFVDHFDDSIGEDNSRVRYDSFMSENIYKIATLYELIGGDLLFGFMNTQSHSDLVHFFENFGSIEQPYVEMIKKLVPTVKEDYKELGQIVLLLRMMSQFRWDEKTSKDWIEMKGKIELVLPDLRSVVTLLMQYSAQPYKKVLQELEAGNNKHASELRGAGWIKEFDFFVISGGETVFEKTAFGKFLEHFEKVNERAKKSLAEHEYESDLNDANDPNRYVVNYATFMSENLFKVAHLNKLLGSDLLFNFMIAKSPTSNLALNRLFQSFSTIAPAYQEFVKKIIPYVKKDYEKLEQILLMLGQISELRHEVEQSGEGIPLDLSDIVVGADLSKIIKILSERLIQGYKKVLQIGEDVEINADKLLNAKPELIRKLLIGRRNLGAKWTNVFDSLVVRDLSSPIQPDELTKQIALHNQSIEEELKTKKIKVEMALRYPEKKEFVFDTDPGVTTLLERCSVVWGSLSALLEQLHSQKEMDAIPEGQQKVLKEILKILEQIDKQIKKGKKGVRSERLLEDALGTPLSKVEEKLNAVLDTIPDGGIREHGIHLSDHIKELREAQESNKKDAGKAKKGGHEKYAFEVKQWDKSDIHTFLLGDYLSCCLATDGAAFHAMVQRRMDAAMFMHVVVDKKSGEPVCGNWLFFARDKNNPDDIYVVANFHEIRAGYGVKPELRKKMVEELNRFTREYAEKIGAKGYIIRPLTYGNIPDAEISGLCSGAEKKIQIEKVGGYFDPLQEGVDEKEGRSRYYLVAVELNSFHQAYQAPPKAENVPRELEAYQAELSGQREEREKAERTLAKMRKPSRDAGVGEKPVVAQRSRGPKRGY